LKDSKTKAKPEGKKPGMPLTTSESTPDSNPPLSAERVSALRKEIDGAKSNKSTKLQSRVLFAEDADEEEDESKRKNRKKKLRLRSRVKMC